uniref:Uncharacterized protein n=1 Tax=Arundo donax TaxID=35708 RepID=A0A0A8YWR6_ARUDO
MRLFLLQYQLLLIGKVWRLLQFQKTKLGEHCQ